MKNEKYSSSVGCRSPVSHIMHSLHEKKKIADYDWNKILTEITENRC